MAHAQFMALTDGRVDADALRRMLHSLLDLLPPEDRDQYEVRMNAATDAALSRCGVVQVRVPQVIDPSMQDGEIEIARVETSGMVRLARGQRLRAQAFRIVKQFNQRSPVGSAVRYWTGVRQGEGKPGITTSAAWLLGGHTPVVRIQGESACVALTHVKPGILATAKGGA